MSSALRLDDTSGVPLVVGPEWDFDDGQQEPLPTDDAAIDAWLEAAAVEARATEASWAGAGEPVAAPSLEHDEDVAREIAEHQQLLARDRGRLASYRALKHLYLLTGQPERAVLCSYVLELLNHGDPEDARVVAEYRRRPFTTARRALDDEGWALLAHPDEDPTLGRLFAIVGETLVSAEAVPRQELGLSRARAIDAHDSHSYNKALKYVAATLGVPLPEAHVMPEQSAPVVLINCRDDQQLAPVILLGEPLVGERRTRHAQVFELARALVQLRPERRVRLASARAIAHAIAVTWALGAEAEGAPAAAATIGTTARAWRQVLSPMALVQIESIGLELRDKGARPEAAAAHWLRASDLTALRAGWALTGDLETCARLVASAGPSPGAPPVKQRLLDLLWSSTTDPLIAVRKRLGLL